MGETLDSGFGRLGLKRPATLLWASKAPVCSAARQRDADNNPSRRAVAKLDAENYMAWLDAWRSVNASQGLAVYSQHQLFLV